MNQQVNLIDAQKDKLDSLKIKKEQGTKNFLRCTQTFNNV